METIAVITGKGRSRLGRRLVERGCKEIDSDLLDFYTLEKQIKSINPTVIINTAAKTDVDFCEKSPITAYTINTFSLENISKNFKGFFVHISSDYVFDGKRNDFDGYTEEDLTNPINTYGYSKLFSEEIVKKNFPEYLIVRTTNLYDSSKYRPCFATWVLDSLREKRRIKVTRELYGNPTYVPHLAEGILYCINKKITGTLNIVGMENMSRYDFARVIAYAAEYDPTDIIFPGLMYALAKRPERAGLNPGKAISLGVPIYSVLKGVFEFIKEENEYKISLGDAGGREADSVLC